MNDLGNAYLEGREELTAACRRHLEELDLPTATLKAVFWGDFYADDAHLPVGIGGATPPRGGFNVPDFSAPVFSDIEKVGPWERLCVTTTWHMGLAEHSGAEAWFDSLSGKNRKKLRWLRNALPKLETVIAPIVTDAEFGMFEKLYCAQFPRHTAGTPEMRALREIYRELEARGRGFTRMLLDRDGNALAAALAYVNGRSIFYTHLTRVRGEYDKFSPGYYLTYAVIREVLETRPELEYFFMGPGEYDYKSALGGTPSPVFRYERADWRNLFGRLRLRHRAAKERRRSECKNGGR